MPNVWKNLFGLANDYEFKPASELKVDPPAPPPPAPPREPVSPPAAQEQTAPPPASAPVAEAEAETEPPEPTPETDPIYFARIQANAILEDAREEAERYREETRAALADEIAAEREACKRSAHDEGYRDGYAEGMARAVKEGREERDRLALEQIKGIEVFLEEAAEQRDKILDSAREELKNLAVAVAEKVIHVSLKNSGDIILRMVDAATDTHKRCEWAHIYISDCDVGGKAYTVPELTAALSHVADRVRVIPMPEEESGTCIVELPDVILDASVSTQLDNVREVLNGVMMEDD